MELDSKQIKTVDKEGIMEQILGLATQCKEAASAAESIEPCTFSPKNIVICGMGGSGICADIACTLLYESLDIPIYVVKCYNIPSFVDKDSLVVAISYSGMTAETVSCIKDAQERGALVYGVASGGEVQRLCGKNFVKVPSGLAPRCAVGAMSIATLSIISSLKPFDFSAQIEETVKVLSSLCERLHPEKENLAKEIARSLLGKIPIVYGADPFTKVAALRWKQEINENGKYICYYHAFPELLHNEITSFEALEHELFLIVLEDKEYHPLVKKAMEFFINHFRPLHVRIKSEGESALARLFSLIYIGDFVSLYLATLRGKDPGAIHSIKLLKKALKE